MKVEHNTERRLEIGGWEVNLHTYKIGDTYYCKADNVSPGAIIARSTGATREEAENKVVAIATERLSATIRRAV
jgi:hypothetical protein